MRLPTFKGLIYPPVDMSDEVHEVIAAVANFEVVKQALEENSIAYLQASLAWLPQNPLEVEGGEAEKVVRLLEAMEDLDDVQKVYSNFDVQEEELQKLMA